MHYRPRRVSDIPQWDSCQFGSNYKGIWELFDLHVLTDGRRISTGDAAKNLVQIVGKHIRFSSTDAPPAGLNVTLQCVHEISETIRDWFIVRTVNQLNGCRPRDLCLELYQSEVRSNFVEKNTNTLQFRLSQSQKQGTQVKSLCDFRSIAYPSRAIQTKILIKQAEDPGPADILKRVLYNHVTEQ
ncbi:unnamed protein product [Echinostoma caproni]|uniref:Ig-like domain-containing protein n=1 Tax=Echinostoma caproni TaxID=27848 RepID=A0A183A7E8_9TREM|nr:unnamed protein product [Echinostoma caproni]